ncbi:unnamed protein product [Meloidogyne enterolobii]|uniref:Uncharacterized protein n=1 Tax=Meloidogyne enterolobii TaxID=390850 RepID=A0ACB0ZYA6_MELEN
MINNSFPSSSSSLNSFKQKNLKEEEQQKQINFNEEREEEEKNGGVYNFWKTSTIERKQQKFNKLFGQKSPEPPPLPTCSPPPLESPPDWETLRTQFKFAVDLDTNPERKAIVRIVRRF